MWRTTNCRHTDPPSVSVSLGLTGVDCKLPWKEISFISSHFGWSLPRPCNKTAAERLAALPTQCRVYPQVFLLWIHSPPTRVSPRWAVSCRDVPIRRLLRHSSSSFEGARFPSLFGFRVTVINPRWNPNAPTGIFLKNSQINSQTVL